MEHEMMEHSEILLYSDENGKEFVNVVFMDETFWLTQVGIDVYKRQGRNHRIKLILCGKSGGQLVIQIPGDLVCGCLLYTSRCV